MKSLFVCFYHIDHHVIVKINCQEKHSFRPFASNETNSARTKIFQTMELIEEKLAIHTPHPKSKITHRILIYAFLCQYRTPHATSIVTVSKKV